MSQPRFLAHRYVGRGLSAHELPSVGPAEVVGADSALWRDEKVGEVRAELVVLPLEGLPPVSQVLARHQVVFQVSPPEIGL